MVLVLLVIPENCRLVKFELDLLREEAPAMADPKFALDDAKLLENSNAGFPNGGSKKRLRDMGFVRAKVMQLFSIQDNYQKLDYTFDYEAGYFDYLPRRYVMYRVKNIENYTVATHQW
jgi:hypothetical protein